MTEQETLEYNKRCAEFLGAIYSKHAEAWGFGNAKNIGSKMFHGVMYHNVIQAERFEKELKFHSDWNWIMDVVEAIEKLTKQDGYGYEILITNSLCVIEETNKIFDSNQRVYAKTTKEAVVGAINEFLIWYEQNK